MLYIIGLGLFDEKDITVKGLEAVKKCDKIYLENYTAVLSASKETLEKFYKKKIELANREFVEQKFEGIIKEAKTKNIALLIVGDALSATTHSEILNEAKKQNVKIIIIHNASIFTAVAETGLQLYKFGKTTSIPFSQKNFHPENFYDALKENKKQELHTLILLDLNPNENKFMTINDAIKILLEIEQKRKEKVFTKETLCIGCARLGSNERTIKYGKVEDLENFDFGKEMHCLIVPGKLHFAEEEMLESFK
jgi:diphthine synthase